MPELPDVEILRRYVNATSLHKTIESVEVRSPEILGNVSAWQLRSRLTGRVLRSTRRHGKHLFVRVDGGAWLTLHFGMTGRLRYFRDMAKEPPHDRLLIGFANGYHLAYDCQRKLGRVGLAASVKSFVREKGLGPDALSVDLAAFRRILAGRRGAIKSALMNQHIVAGIGNIYSDEILFQIGVHPLTRVNELDSAVIKRLFEATKRVLQTAINRRADSKRLPGSYLIPHRFKRGRCPRCRAELERIKVSGRTAYYCPRSQ